MADGSIVIDTKIDEKGLKDGTKDLKSAIEQLSKSIETLSTSITSTFSGIQGAAQKAASEVNTISASYDKAQKSAEEMRKEAENIPINRGDVTVDENAYKKKTTLIDPKNVGYDKNAMDFIDDYVSKTEKGEKSTNEFKSGIQDLNNQLKDLEGQGLYFGDEEYDKAYLSLQKLEQALKDYKKELVAPTPNAYPFGINTMQGQIVDLQIKLKKLSESGKSLGDANYDNVYVQLTRAKEAASAYAKELTKIQNIKSPGERIFDGVVGGLKKLYSTAKSAVLMLGKIVGTKIANGLKKLSSGILGIHKSSNKSTISLGKLLKYTFGIRSLYVLFNKMRGAIVDGFQNLVQYSGSTNKTLSSLIGSLTQLKNSFATAFAPILTAVAPILNYLIGLLNSAVTAIAQFMAAITGQKTFTKATKVQEDYAKSIKKTGGAAKEAKGELASFDKLNVQKDDDSSGGGGGTSPADMFETAEVESRFKQMADKIKGFIKNEDWSGLGAYMADGINAGLQKIYDAINWDNVGPKIAYFVNAFTQTFNSLVDNIDWDLMGRVLGAGINTLVNTLLLFVDGIDWKNLGAKLAVWLNGLVDEIDWENLGRLFMAKFNIIMEMLDGFVNGNGKNAGFDFTKFGESLGQGINGAIDSIDPKVWAGALSGTVKGLFDTLNGILSETDWQEIGTKLAEYVGAIDYGGILEALSKGIGGVLGAIGSVIIGFLKPGWNAAVKWWKETAFKDGQFTMQGLIDGINQKWADIKTWVKEHIFQPFIDGFKAAFGIHSPSTVMAEMGGYLMDGLINKVGDMTPNLIDKISEMKSKISDKWDEIKTNAKDKWDEIKKSISDSWSDINKESGSNVSDLKKSMSDAWDDLVDKTKEAWKNISDTVKGTVKGIKEKAKTVGSKIAGAIGIETYNVPGPSGPVALPHLASGTVVPPRAGEFAAVLGDNKRETEVVSPLSTIKKALLEALQEAGDNGGNIEGHIYLDGKELGNSTVKFVRQEKKRTGKNPVLV